MASWSKSLNSFKLNFVLNVTPQINHHHASSSKFCVRNQTTITWHILNRRYHATTINDVAQFYIAVPKVADLSPKFSRRSKTTELTTLTKALKDVSLIGILFKWKLSLWIALSTFPGYLMSTSAAPLPSVFMALGLGTFLCSAGANTFNQVFERDRDALMSRTRARPLPSGLVTDEWAIKVACFVSITGIGILLMGTNPITALLGGVNIGLYAMVYTKLKTITPYSVHIGSVVGSVPTLMGWTASGASLLAPDPWMLFAIQTFWQFPHFYGLAWRHRLDYLKAGFQSFISSDLSGHQTAQLMERYIIATVLLPTITTSFYITNTMFMIDGTFINYFLWDSFKKFQNDPSAKTSKQFFGVSLWHLLIFLSLAVFHSRSLHSFNIDSTTTSQTAVSQLSSRENNHVQSRHQTSRCPWTGSPDYHLHHRIKSLRELVEEFCIHKQLNRLDYAKEFCIFDKMEKKLTSIKYSHIIN